MIATINPIAGRSAEEARHIAEWMHDVPSPAFVLEENKLRQNLELMARVQHESGAKIILALKGFAQWSVFPLVRQFLPGATASSLFELRLSAEKFARENHIYSAGYRADEFDEIAGLADHLVFNSVGQLDRFGDAARLAGASVGLRVNPGIAEVEFELYNPCRAGSRLGTRPEFIDNEVFDRIDGIHAHALCESDVDATLRLMAALEAQFGHVLSKMRWVNLGGGHLMTRPGYDIDALIEGLRAFRERWDVELYLEPGSAVALNTGVLVATVLDIVDTELNPVAILDISATAHMPDVLEQPYRPEVVGGSLPDVGEHTYRLGGGSCLAGDAIGEYSFASPLEIGDRLVFEDQMHYTMVKTTMFNGMNHPSIVVQRESGELDVVRTFTYEDFRDRLS